MNEAAYLAAGIVLGAWIRGGMRLPGWSRYRRHPKIGLYGSTIGNIRAKGFSEEMRDKSGSVASFTMPPEWDESPHRGGFVDGEAG